MIHLSFSLLVVIYLLVMLGVIFSAWICHGVVEKRRAARNLRYRLRCASCSIEFADESATPLPRCPRCGSLNEREKVSRV